MAKTPYGQGLDAATDFDLVSKAYADANYAGGSGGGGGGGAFEYLDTIEVTGSDVTSVTFGFGGDGELGTALNGDSDEAYFIEFYLPASGGTTAFTLEPNGISANQMGGLHLGGQSVSNAEVTALEFANQATGRSSFGKIDFQAKSGKPRAMQVQTTETDLSAQSWHFAYGCAWNDTSTVITSIDIVASVASAIKIGARFVLYRRKPQAPFSTANLVPAGLEFVDQIVVASDQTTVSFGAGGDGTYQTALDGDSDEEYFLSYRFAPNTGTATWELRPNGVTSNIFSARHFGGSSHGNTTGTIMQLGIAAGGFEGYGGQASLIAKTGLARWFSAKGLQYQGATRVAAINEAVWTDNSTNITSLDIVADVASEIRAGTVITLFRRRAIPSNGVIANTVLAADATDLDLTGLEGDAHGEYEISGKIKLTTASNTISLKINGATTNVRIARVVSGATEVVSTTGLLVSSSSVTSRNEFSFRGRIWAGRTPNGVAMIRSMELQATHTFDNGDNINIHQLAVAYEDSAADLTSIGFVCSVGSGILAGSQVKIRRVA